MPFAKLFRTRWAALMWSAGMLWTAADIAGLAAAPPPELTAPPPVHDQPRPLPKSEMDPAMGENLAILNQVVHGN